MVVSSVVVVSSGQGGASPAYKVINTVTPCPPLTQDTEGVYIVAYPGTVLTLQGYLRVLHPTTLLAAILTLQTLLISLARSVEAWPGVWTPTAPPATAWFTAAGDGGVLHTIITLKTTLWWTTLSPHSQRGQHQHH